MNIVLGIYNNGYFRSVVNESTFNCAYPFTELIGDYWVDEAEGVIDTVLEAAIKCDKIIFLIDGLLPNISGNEDSYTCQELITILSCSLIPLSKIEFRDNNEIVTSDYVMNKLNLNKELFIK
jgi:hypothetical protein